MSGYDVIVVGAGPAGMAAAAASAEAGCRVRLLDDNHSTGGQIWRRASGETRDSLSHGKEFLQCVDRLREAKAEIRSGTRVVAQPRPGSLRVEHENSWSDLQYERLILATGAREVFLPFPGWTLPGVMGAGGLQALVKGGLPIAGKRVVLSGSGPLLLAVAAELARRGAHIEGVYEQASLGSLIRLSAGLIGHPRKIVEGLRYRNSIRSTPYRAGSWVTEAHGSQRLASVTVCCGGKLREIRCDFLGCGFHLTPNLELPRLLGCQIEAGSVSVDAEMRTSVAGIFSAGELTGIGGLEKALIEGEIAGRAAAGKPTAHLHRRRERLVTFGRNLDTAFRVREEIATLSRDETVICRCEDVKRSALATAQSWREAKLHTRCGMGPCQGRVCGPASAFLFGWQPDEIRPPSMPASLATLAAPCENESRIDLFDRSKMDHESDTRL
jgi:NADPH-dependent 2,4-dienoyl-CoA reductase/sulfur reductase-like enzyme